MRRLRNNCLVVLILVSCLFGCATTQDFIALDDRISELELHRVESERKNANLRSHLRKQDNLLVKGDKDLKDRYARVDADIEILKGEIQSLKGSLEEIQHRIGQLQNNASDREKELERFDRAGTKNSDRIIRLEQYLGFEPGVKGVEGKGKAEVPLEKGSAGKIYSKAKQDFDASKFDDARTGFQTLIDRYPDSKKADNAQFWIGETYFREKWYEKAILEYQKVIKKYPKGNKVASAMLKQAMSFKNIGDQSNYRLILNELVKKYPKSNEAGIARKKLQ